MAVIEDDGYLLKAVYCALICHPHDEWRAKNQALYAAVRDRIASDVGITAEDTQNWFEQESVQDWFRKRLICA